MEDWRLLRSYVDERSEAAFTTLVNRYLPLVYSAAFRRVGNPDSARDVTQSVFCLLAQKASRFGPSTTLVSWLYRTACYKAEKYWRDECRRQKREQEVAQMNMIEPDPESSWEQVSRQLDSAMEQLGESDRLAILLRFFQDKPLREVGLVLGVAEEAARKRASRSNSTRSPPLPSPPNTQSNTKVPR